MSRRVLVALAAVVLFLLGGVLPARAQEAPDERFQDLFKQGLASLEKRDFDPAIDAFKKAIAVDQRPPEPYYNIACAYALRGSKEQALDWLGEALRHGFNDEKHIEQDHDLDAIRGEARFAELMTKAFTKAGPGESLVTLKGEVASLEKLRGKVVILAFWRTWCEPAKQVVPALAGLQSDWGARGLVVVGISNEPVPSQEQLADELKINYMLLRQVGPLPKPYDHVAAFPTIFVLDGEGKVVKKLVGARDRAEIEEVVKSLLAPSPEPASAKKGEPQEF
jgi:thiol-disulfide isomerase/thioredoxin